MIVLPQPGIDLLVGSVQLDLVGRAARRLRRASRGVPRHRWVARRACGLPSRTGRARPERERPQPAAAYESGRGLQMGSKSFAEALERAEFEHHQLDKKDAKRKRDDEEG